MEKEIEKEFNLSEKIYGKDMSEGILFTEDVKEFIRRENKLIDLYNNKKISWATFILRRYKLCGEKLR